MKTTNLILTILFVVCVFSQTTAQVQAVPDANFRAVLKAKFSTLDANNDDIITESEIFLINNLFSSNGLDLNLHFTDPNVFTYDLTGIELFECKIVKLFSDLPLTNANPSGWVSIDNFDLTKLKDKAGTNCGNCGYIKELYLYRINADPNQLKIESATDLLKVTAIESNGLDKLDEINKNDPTQASIEDIYLEATDDFYATNLDLTGVNSLKTVSLTKITLDTLKVASGNLTSVALYNISDLKMVGLPYTTPNPSGFNNTSKLESLIIDNTDQSVPLILSSIDLSDQLLLKGLTIKTNMFNTTFTSLDISKNTALNYLQLEGLKGVSSLNVTQNTLLTNIYLRYMHFSLGTGNVDFTKNTELLNLTCETVFMTSLDVTKNTKLTELRCADNQITTLDTSKNVDLTYLDFSTNQLTSLDVSTNTKLEKLLVNDNAIEKLNITNNPMLLQLNCNNNQLTALNVANGNNSNMNSFESEYYVRSIGNSNLRCIYVDANVLSSIPDTWIKDDTASYALDDEIIFPSTNFRDALLTNPDIIDVDGNGKISTCEAENFTGTISVANQSIASVSGLEKFVNATGLDCSNNAISALDVSTNTKLKTLKFANNNVPSIDITNLTQIELFDGSNNSLTALILGNNKTTIKDFNFSHNNISGSYSTDGLSNLETFVCNDNQLQHIGVTLNTKLKTLHCQNNPFSSAGAIDNTIDLSNNTDLLQLNCNNNQLEDLDVSNNTGLTLLKCNGNNLKKLNIANGNNANLTVFEASGNSVLYCIQVDASILNNIPNTWIIDTHSNYSDIACVIAECTEITIPDTNFKAALLNHTPRIDLDFDGKIEECEIDNYLGGIIDVKNKSITDFTGLEKFINVAVFDLSGNPTTSIDVTLLGEMTKLTIRNTQITSLDLSNNAKLINIFGANNSALTSVNAKNGNNNIIADLEFHNCPLLNYICVDDVNYANTQSSTNNAQWTKDTSATYTDNCSLSVKDNTLQFSIKLYPNPVSDVLNVNNQSNQTIAKIEIYNLLGRKIAQSNRKELLVKHLSKGVYLVKIITTSNKYFMKKIIKQ